MRKLIYYAGIDPGFTGAIAFISPDGKTYFVHDAPTREVAFTKNGKKATRPEFAPGDMVDLLQEYTLRAIAIEEVTARAGQGVTSMFRFGHGLGLWQGMAIALNIACMKPRPAEWKLAFNLVGEDKDASRLLAREHFPNAELHLKKHHGRAEALLLAEYARWTYERTS